jgi:para-nitrobenzyl esterase
VQGVVWDDIDLSGPATSEDCLYLNIWTPAAPGTEARLAVMVWIHGGGFVVGSGAEPRYDGARLAARGIVVVTVNHRLNALGFLAHNNTSIICYYFPPLLISSVTAFKNTLTVPWTG